MTTLTDKAAAERERKANIRRGKERLAALDPAAQAVVQNLAATIETADGGKKAGWRYLEQALDGYERETPTAEATIDLDDPVSVAAGVETLATGLMDDLRAKVRAARATDGLTLAEIQQKFNLHPNLVKELLGDLAEGNGRGAAKEQAKAERAASRRRPAREVRGDAATRQEKCPSCDEWKPAVVDDAGEYVAEADYRKGRADCRACYNRRWREGVERRKNAAGK